MMVRQGGGMNYGGIMVPQWNIGTTVVLYRDERIKWDNIKVRVLSNASLNTNRWFLIC